MAEKDKVFDSKIRQTGVFDFKEFYRFCYTYLADDEYDITENKYTEKVAATGKEIEIDWLAERKISDYFKFVMKISWRILGMVDVEVQKNNAKVKMNKGQVEVNVAAYIEKDYENRWEENPFLKFLRGAYDKWIIKERIKQYEAKIFGEADDFVSEAKAFLELEGQH